MGVPEVWTLSQMLTTAPIRKFAWVGLNVVHEWDPKRVIDRMDNYSNYIILESLLCCLL